MTWIGRASKPRPYFSMTYLSERRPWEQGGLPNQRHNFRAHVRQFFGGYRAFSDRFSNAPIQALHLIGQHRTRRCAGNNDLEWIFLDLCRHWTADHQTGLVVIWR